MAKSRRIWPLVVFVVVLHVAAAAGAIYFFAAPIAATVIAAALDRAGIAHGDISVRAISLQGIKLAPVSLGVDGEITADAITVGWTLEGLRARKVERITVEKPRFQINVTKSGIEIPGLVLAPGGGGAPVLPFSEVDLADAEIRVHAPGVAALVSGDISLRAGADGKLEAGGYVQADLKVQAGEAAPVPATVRLMGFQAAMDGARATFGASKIAIVAPSFRGAADVDVTASLAEPMTAQGRFALRGKLDVPDGGSADVTLDIPAMTADLSARRATAARIEAAASLPNGSAQMSGAVSLDFGDHLSALGNVRLDATLPQRGGAPVRLAASVPSWNFDFAKSAWAAKSVSAKVATALGTAEIVSGLDVVLGQEMTANGAKLAATAKLFPPDGEPVTASLNAPAWHAGLEGKTVKFTAPKLDATANQAANRYAATLNGLDFSGGQGPFTDWAKLATRVALAPVEGHRLPPADVSADLELDSGIAKFSGAGAAYGGKVKATFEGYHDLGDGTGRVAVEATPVVISKSFRPPELLALLPDTVRNLAGRFAATAEIRYGGRSPLAATVSANLDGVGFEAGGARVSGIAGRIAPLELLPLRTPARQTLTGTLHADPAPPMPFTLAFRLPGDDTLRVEELRLDALGGAVSVGNLAIATGRPVAGQIHIDGADLAALLKLIDVQGLSGEGTLSGTIPVRIDQTKVDVAGGVLAAAGAGVLRYTGSGLDKAAAAAGEGARDQIDLLRRALRNFHYDALSFGIDRDAEGNGTLALHLSGRNPDVLEGHPFNININLETNFDRLAAVLLDGVAAANRLMKRGIGRQ